MRNKDFPERCPSKTEIDFFGKALKKTMTKNFPLLVKETANRIKKNVPDVHNILLALEETHAEAGYMDGIKIRFVCIFFNKPKGRVRR